MFGFPGTILYKKKKKKLQVKPMKTSTHTQTSLLSFKTLKADFS